MLCQIECNRLLFSRGIHPLHIDVLCVAHILLVHCSRIAKATCAPVHVLQLVNSHFTP